MSPVPLGQLDSMVLQAQWVILGMLVLWVLQERLGHVVLRELLGPLAHMDQRVLRGLQELQVRQELDLLVPLDRMVRQGPRVRRGPRARPASDQLVPLDWMVLQGRRVPKVDQQARLALLVPMGQQVQLGRVMVFLLCQPVAKQMSTIFSRLRLGAWRLGKCIQLGSESSYAL